MRFPSITILAVAGASVAPVFATPIPVARSNVVELAGHAARQFIGGPGIHPVTGGIGGVGTVTTLDTPPSPVESGTLDSSGFDVSGLRLFGGPLEARQFPNSPGFGIQRGGIGGVGTVTTSPISIGLDDIPVAQIASAVPTASATTPLVFPPLGVPTILGANRFPVFPPIVDTIKRDNDDDIPVDFVTLTDSTTTSAASAVLTASAVLPITQLPVLPPIGLPTRIVFPPIGVPTRVVFPPLGLPTHIVQLGLPTGLAQ